LLRRAAIKKGCVSAAFFRYFTVRVHADVSQAVVDYGKDNYPGHDACDRTHTAGEGDAAHHAGGNRIQLIHKAEVVGGATNTARFQQTAKRIEHT